MKTLSQKIWSLGLTWTAKAAIGAVTLQLAVAQATTFPKFDQGPDLQDDMQKELVEIIQDLPYVPGVSEQLKVLSPREGVKFRKDFGAMPIRGFLKPNSISTLVIGQDGTHIAEGANRPGIAGFGGRVQDMLLHFGILEGVAFTNLYVNTISGQYGSRATPVVVSGKSVRFQNVIENRQWLMTHEGPYGEWRNRFISWIIRNNLDSLKMVLLLGQAGKDAGSNFINSIGGKIGAFSKVGDGSQYQVPVFKMVNAGGNNEFAVAITKDGEDVAELLRQVPEFKSAILKKVEANIAQTETEFKSANPAGFAEYLKVKKSGSYSAWNNLVKKYRKFAGPLKILNGRVASLNNGLDYRDGDAETGEGVSTENAKDLLATFSAEAIKRMVFTKGGPAANGVLYPAQFGGWDLDTMTVNGAQTRSIKGLKIPCGTSQVGACSGQSSVTAPDIVFVGAPHPTSLSKGTPESASQLVESELLAPLKAEQARGWQAPLPEGNMDSPFLKGQNYRYGRGVIPPSHGDPGITDMRLLPVSTAQRDGSSAIIIGTRGNANFDASKRQVMEGDRPSNGALLTSHNVLTGRPKFQDWLSKYDRGPSDVYAKLLYESLKKSEILAVKPSYQSQAVKVGRPGKEVSYANAQEAIAAETAKAKTLEDREDAILRVSSGYFEAYGIDAFNFKSHPEAGFYGHYRGTFTNPRVVILADPHGYDSFITSKAATGERGQYLNGLMKDLGVGANYLVISTVPVPMEGATQEEWDAMLALTQSYRENLLKKILADSKPELLIADGSNAAKEILRMGLNKSVPFEAISQDGTADSDIRAAGARILQKGKLQVAASVQITGTRVDIPREHLTWIARVWEGTSGDRVITATDRANKGKAFLIVAPNWARGSKVYLTESQQRTVNGLIDRLAEAGEPIPGESLSGFMGRRAQCASVREKAEGRPEQGCRVVQPAAVPGVLPTAGSY